jgi:serine/threonine-protein kinase
MDPAAYAGKVVGDRYRIGRALGSGGMSSVFVAEDLKRPDRPRAVKVMAPFLLTDERSRARFEQEALIGRALKHPNIVDVLAAGVDPSLGSPWIAMELLEGKTLTDAIEQRGPLPADEVRRIFVDFGSAVSAAHQAGAVHRDLKPDNIFLASTPSKMLPYTVKVLDFGIAKVRKDVSALNSQIMGTPVWMAPEQLAPGTPIDPSTDAWAFGLIAFAALTAKPYWKVANEPAMNLPKLFGEIMAEEIVAPSRRAAELGVNVALPPAFDAWFLHCVARDASARFPTIADATRALDRALGGARPTPSEELPAVAPPTPPAKASEPPPQPPRARPRWPYALVAVLVVVLAIAGGFALRLLAR